MTGQLVMDKSSSYSDMVVEDDQDFRVNSRIYTDHAVFDEEMRRIFERTWVYVGHTSELRNVGDYKTSKVGKNPVIVTHARDGKIYVLLNACRHRGNAVCRTSRGSARTFMCPYHGWAYQNDGALIGVTSPEGYPPDFAKKLGGLLRLRVGINRGLIFASMTDDVPPIEQHLGDMRKYVDLWADLSPEPEFTAALPHHYAYDGNWKFQAESTAGTPATRMSRHSKQWRNSAERSRPAQTGQRSDVSVHSMVGTALSSDLVSRRECPRSSSKPTRTC
jgi:phenylpropionate dioxygenase-like ring-hydroxylating dioxygenase large terminal subunit